MGLWGQELADKIINATEQRRVDVILMADVLYHKEHFDDLLTTIRNLLQPSTGQLIMVFEQRRKDLSTFVNELALLFDHCTCDVHTVTRDTEEGSKSINIYIVHFRGFTDQF